MENWSHADNFSWHLFAKLRGLPCLKDGPVDKILLSVDCIDCIQVVEKLSSQQLPFVGGM